MPDSLDLILSPYHLATREPPAMLALTLGDRVATLLPRPTRGESRDGVKSTIEAAPRYLRLMESWRWSGPLWQAGVLAGGLSGEQACDEIDSVYSDIDESDTLCALRPLTRGAVQRTTESRDKALDAIAGDVLKGGPDPGISIPINAAIDRFSLRHNALAVRGGASSIAQRAEARLTRKVFSVALPILVRAGGGRLQRLRRDLKQQLSDLRSAILECRERALIDVDASPSPSFSDSPESRAAMQHLSAAVAAYRQAFQDWSRLGARGDDENDERIVVGFVSLTGAILPGDAVLRSSRAAMRALQGAGVGVPAGGAIDDSNAPIVGSEASLFTLIVREMTLEPDALMPTNDAK